MDFNIDFNLVRSQKLLLIPQLKQALEVLEMNSQELRQYIEFQMESNPALEIASDQMPDETSTEIQPERNMNDIAEEDPDIPGNGYTETVLSLKEHLIIQLNGLCMDRCEHRIGEYLVDNTDQNGYLSVEIQEVAAFFNVPEEKVLRVLTRLQSLDPPGICARNLRECLLLQLEQEEDVDRDAVLIVERYLDELACDDVESVVVSTSIPVERVRAVFKKVKNLEPRPGREFYDSKTENTAPPDIIIREVNDGFQVLTNEEAFPDICLSESFTAGTRGADISQDGECIRDKANDAVWLIKCLEQREEIILAIARKLCLLEKDFLSDGPKAVKQIDKTTFAAMLDMHESILEKAIKGKYLQCRWGMYELRDFFAEELPFND